MILYAPYLPATLVGAFEHFMAVAVRSEWSSLCDTFLQARSTTSRSCSARRARRALRRAPSSSSLRRTTCSCPSRRPRRAWAWAAGAAMALRRRRRPARSARGTTRRTRCRGASSSCCSSCTVACSRGPPPRATARSSRSARGRASRFVGRSLIFSCRVVSALLVSSRLGSARFGSARLGSARLVSSRLVSSLLFSSRDEVAARGIRRWRGAKTRTSRVRGRRGVAAASKIAAAE